MNLHQVFLIPKNRLAYERILHIFFVLLHRWCQKLRRIFHSQRLRSIQLICFWDIHRDIFKVILLGPYFNTCFMTILIISRKVGIDTCSRLKSGEKYDSYWYNRRTTRLPLNLNAPVAHWIEQRTLTRRLSSILARCVLLYPQLVNYEVLHLSQRG